MNITIFAHQVWTWQIVDMQNNSQWRYPLCPIPQFSLVGVRISYIFIFPGHPEFWTALQTLLCGGPWMYPVTALLGWEVWPTRKVLDYTVNYPPECLDHRCIKVLTFQLLTQIVCSSHRVYKCSWNLHIILGEAPLLICEPSADNILITHCDWDETNSHGLLSPVEEKGWHSHFLEGRVPRSASATLSREECPDPWLDRPFFLFWAHYIEDGPHLLCTGSL